jgi:hypothetical protein
MYVIGRCLLPSLVVLSIALAIHSVGSEFDLQSPCADFDVHRLTLSRLSVI